MNVSSDCRLQRNPEIIFTDLDDTVVMMDPDRGYYYELDAVATRIWALLDSSQSVAQLCDALVREYDVTPDDCRRDVVAFVAEAGELGIVAVQAA